MPRRYKPARRVPNPDPLHNDVQVAKFINMLMRRGKKNTSESILYGAFEIIKEQVKDAKPLDVFHDAIKKATPLVEVKARRVGGSTYQVPIEVDPDRGWGKSVRWLIIAAKGRNGKSMREKLAQELMSARRGEGAAIKKKDDTHRMAEANKAFAHYRY
jgi:small subunit ribosomal protein S7